MAVARRKRDAGDLAARHDGCLMLVAAHASSGEEVIRAREVLRSVAAKGVTATGESSLPMHARA